MDLAYFVLVCIVMILLFPLGCEYASRWRWPERLRRAWERWGGPAYGIEPEVINGLGPNQRKWLASLRSGVRKQGRAGLACRSSEWVADSGAPANWRYCCLGDGCESLGIPGQRIVDYDIQLHYGTEQTIGMAPKELVELLALRDEVGHTLHYLSRNIEETYPKDLPRSCVYMNDSLLWSFDEIADYIEANPKEIFTEPR